MCIICTHVRCKHNSNNKNLLLQRDYTFMKFSTLRNDEYYTLLMNQNTYFRIRTETMCCRKQKENIYDEIHSRSWIESKQLSFAKFFFSTFNVRWSQIFRDLDSFFETNKKKQMKLRSCLCQNCGREKCNNFCINFP